MGAQGAAQILVILSTSNIAAMAARFSLLAWGLLAALMLGLMSPAFLGSPAQTRRQSAISTTLQTQPAQALGGAALLASLPAPAHAGGMFDFGLTLPFVAVTFLLMMVVLNAIWYSPVTNEMEERNAKLLQTLSEATDMLTKADEIQVEYTEQIRVARDKASKAVADYRKPTQASIDAKLAAAARERDTKKAEVKAKVFKDIQARIAAAENDIEAKKTDFVKGILAKATV